MKKYDYLIKFDFTTVHKGSRFIGRSGEIEIFTTAKNADEVREDIETIKQMCADAVHQQKPNWNIFMINVKEIKMLNRITEP